MICKKCNRPHIEQPICGDCLEDGIMHEVRSNLATKNGKMAIGNNVDLLIKQIKAQENKAEVRQGDFQPVFACGNCKNCKHWERTEDDWQYTDITLGRDTEYEPLDEDESKRLYGYNVRFCKHEKLKFYEKPTIDGACVVDGSEYKASLLTAENFGCINFESKQTA